MGKNRVELPRQLEADLRTRYSEPQRHYHNWQHVEELLDLFEVAGPQLADPNAVYLAILFHDAIYDPKATDNEERSAELLRDKAVGLVGLDSLDRAERMILATIHHELPDGLSPEELGDAAIFLDMDLAILAAPQERFDEYETQIRREYAHVPDEAFRIGRADILRRFARRDQLYFSEWGKARFEAQARNNLNSALAA